MCVRKLIIFLKITFFIRINIQTFKFLKSLYFILFYILCVYKYKIQGLTLLQKNTDFFLNIIKS